MKAIRKFSLVCLLSLLVSGCFHVNPTSNNVPPSSVSSGESSDASSASSDSSSSSSSSSTSKYSHGPNDTLVESITLANTTYSMNVNKNITIVATVLPKDATNKKLIWTSSDPEVATVDSTGVVHSVKPGVVTITAMATDGTDIVASATVTVNAIEVRSITITKSQLTYHVGEQFYIDYSIYPSNASFKQVTYEIADKTVLAVDDNGLFTPIDSGHSDVMVYTTNPNVYARCSVEIKDTDITGFEFRDDSIDLHVGETFTLEPNYYPASASVLETTYRSNNTEVVTVDNDGFITALKEGSARITARTAKGQFSDYIDINVLDENTIGKTTLKYNYKDKFNNSAYGYANSPHLGDVKWIVVPVWFTDSTTYILESKKEDVRADISNAFFGTNSSVGWRSVSGFYKDESFGKLNLTGKVTDWYDVGQASSSITSTTGVHNLGGYIYNWFRSTYPEENIYDYDHDRDGVLDALIMIYALPVDGDTFWAYCSFGYTNRASQDEIPNLGPYMWASYSFMYGNNVIQSRTGVGGRYSQGDTYHAKIDTHTFIHESGHLLGANDYYDYSGQYSPAGAYTMQDNDWGMHDPYSTMAYGWADPYIPQEDCTITIGSFEKTGDVVILSPQWNINNSPFDEYIAIEYFTPTGVNQFDSTYGHRGITVNKNGCRVWHVDTRLAYSTNYSFSITQLTTNPKIAGNKVEYAFNNTFYRSGYESRLSVLGQKYADYCELQLIRNYDNVTYKNQWAASQNDFYCQGDSFAMDGARELNQFVNKGKLNSGFELGWEVEFLAQNSSTATLRIKKV